MDIAAIDRGDSDDALHATRDALLDGVVAALHIARDATAAFPPLQSAVGGVVGIIDVLKKMQANVEQIRALDKYVTQLSITCQNPAFQDETKCPKDLRRRISALEKQLNEATERIQRLGSQSRILRFLSSDVHAGTIEEYITQISWAINNFVIGGTMSIELAIDDLSHVVGSGFDAMTGRFDAVTEQIEGISSQMLAASSGPTLRFAVAARFDHPSQRVACEGQTRLETLATIYQWLLPDHPQPASSRILQRPRADARIFWLSGLAGTGKSTVAQTVAEWCSGEKRRVLGASFFCSRANRECSDVQMIVPTIAYQLGLFYPAFQQRVTEVLQEDPHIQMSLVSRQLKRLIVDPLQELPQFPRCAIVIDALDECKDDQATSLIIRALSQYVSALGPLKIVLTSRPVQNITYGFRSTALSASTQHLALHEVPLHTTERDIGTFLRSRLSAIRERYSLDRSWPTSSQVATLIELSNRLFIYAATVVRYIEDANASNPRSRLQTLLSGQRASSATSLHQLDDLYLQVLTSAYPNITQELKSQLKIVLGTVILTRDRLSPSAIDRLMILDTGTVRATLAHLQSAVTVPDEDGAVITLIHPSFHEFLTNKERCRNPDFLINPAIQHRLIAQRCLQSMINELRTDICGIGQSVLNSEIHALPTLIAAHISPSLQYASVHWAYHFSVAAVDSDILALLETFCNRLLLNWLEVMSLLGDLSGAITALQAVRECLAGLPLSQNKLDLLLYSCQRGIQQSFPGLSSSYYQAYVALVPFCPTSSDLRERYGTALKSAPKVLSGLPSLWDTCILTMEGHPSHIQAVSFSADGRRVGCSDLDPTFRLWDVLTGSHLHSLEGHKDAVKSVAFSPDGRYLASCCRDPTVMLWDTSTGANLRVMEGHTDWVQYVEFSPDSRLLVSGSDDRTIRLWDIADPANTPKVLTPLNGRGVMEVRFSRSGTLLASVGTKGICMIWTVASGICTRAFPRRKYTLYALAFSPDEMLLASGGSDTILLHDVTSGSLVHTFRHEAGVRSLDFSPDGLTLACAGLSGGTIALWDMASGTIRHTLSGHHGGISSIRFSPDGRHIASGGEDFKLRVWDITLLPDKRRKPDRKWLARNPAQADMSISRPDVYLVAFSPDGSVVASGTSDCVINLWAAADGSRLQVLRGHTSLIDFLLLSSDHNKLLTWNAGQQYAVRLWDVGRDLCLCSAEDMGIVQAASFSPDNSRVIIGSMGGCVHIWEAGKPRTIRTSTTPFTKYSIYPAGSIGSTSCASISADGSLIAFGYAQGGGFTLGQVSIEARRPTRTARYGETFGVPIRLAFSEDGSRLLMVSYVEQACSITLWDVWSYHAGKASSRRPTEPEAAFLCRYEREDHARHIGFSSSQRSVILNGSTVLPIAQEYWPLSATRSAGEDIPEDHVAYLSEDSWLWCASATETRRLCWVPSSFRFQGSSTSDASGLVAVHGNVVVCGFRSEQPVILDMSPCMSRS